MRIQTPNQPQKPPTPPTGNKKPTLPEFEPTETTSITRTFELPVTHSEKLGTIPNDHYETVWSNMWNTFGQGWHEDVNYDNNGIYGGHDVYGDVPEYDASGKPKMQTVTETLTEKSYNQKAGTIGSAVAGGVTGLGASALTGAMRHAGFSPVAAAVATLVGGVAGAAIGYTTAQGDKVVEEQQSHSITHPRLQGYTHNVYPQTHTEEYNVHYDQNNNRLSDQRTVIDGYHHTYTANINERSVGSYTRPALEHTKSVSPVGAGALGALAGGVAGVAVQLLVG